MGYEPAIGLFGLSSITMCWSLAVPLIAYGILRAHLFDTDLRIRWMIKQSTLAPRRSRWN